MARALEAQFTFPLNLDFVHYRGASARLSTRNAGLPDQHVEITIIDEPEKHMLRSFNGAATRQELLTWLHHEVDQMHEWLKTHK